MSLPSYYAGPMLNEVGKELPVEPKKEAEYRDGYLAGYRKALWDMTRYGRRRLLDHWQKTLVPWARAKGMNRHMFPPDVS